MKYYKCPKCNGASTALEWNQRTARACGGSWPDDTGIRPIEEVKGTGNWFKCPKCDRNSSSGFIALQVPQSNQEGLSLLKRL